MLCDSPGKQVCVGETHTHPFVVTPEHIAICQSICGDTHPIHIGPKAIAQGALQWLFIGRAVTDMLGIQYVPVAQTGDFTLPLLPNKNVVITLTVYAVDTDSSVRLMCKVAYESLPNRVTLFGTIRAHKMR